MASSGANPWDPGASHWVQGPVTIPQALGIRGVDFSWHFGGAASQLAGQVANSSSGTTNNAGSSTTVSASAKSNQALGQKMAAAAPYNWTGSQWQALDQLWTRESGWSNIADNASSGAYGIPQSLPATKMPAAAQASPAGSSSPSAQIAWGLQYIKDTYGNPVNAWAHEVRYGWY